MIYPLGWPFLWKYRIVVFRRRIRPAKKGRSTWLKLLHMRNREMTDRVKRSDGGELDVL